MKERIIYISTIVVACLFIIIGAIITNSPNQLNDTQLFNIGEILSIDNIDTNPSMTNSSLNDKNIHFTAELKLGHLKDTVVSGIQSQDVGNGFVNDDVKVGDKILITESSGTWYFAGYNKIPALIFLCLLFLGLIVLIGKKKGLHTILALLFTCLSIFLVYIPAILSGFNIYILTMIVSIFIITISLILINGYNKKTLGAIAGNIGGVIITGILAFIFNSLLKLTGILDSDYIYLSLLEQPIDLVALVWSGIIIGAIGAIMDVSMTISSSIHEIASHMKKIEFKKLFTSGMNIGKDAIGTMTNTLILAYIGSSIAIVLLLTTYTKSPLNLFNMEMIAVEISQAVIGSIGILIAVPITAAIASYLYSKKKIS